MTSYIHVDDRDVYRSQSAVLNSELSTAVMDSLHASAPMLADVMESIQGWKQRWSSYCDNNAEMSTKFDVNFLHPNPVGYTTSSLDAEAGLSLQADWIQAYGPVEAKIESVSEIFDDIFRGIIAPQKRQDAIMRLNQFVAKVFPLGDHETVAGMFELHDLQHADPLALLKAEFTRTQHAISVIEAQLAQTIEEREACARAEDVKGAEERSLDAIQTMKSIIDLAYRRHRDAITAEVDVSQFNENVVAAQSQLNERCGAASNENSTIQANAANDAQVVQVFTEAFEVEHQEKAELYANRMAKFKADMQENTKLQIGVWESVIQQLQKLSGLAHEREEIAVAHMADTVQEKQRQQHVAEVRAAIVQRKAELDSIGLNTTRALDYLTNCQQYRVKADEHITRLQHPAKLSKIEVEEGLRSYDIFKRYMVASNSVLFRREQRLENVRRLLRSTEFQIANAIETLDTDLPTYRIQLQSLNATEVQLSNAVQDLSTDIQDQIDKWFPIESFLDERRVDFDPPSLLVQELKRDMMITHVEAVDELTNKEQKLLDGEKANIRKMLNAVETAKEAFRDRSGNTTSGH